MTLSAHPRDSHPDATGIRRTPDRMWFDELPHTAHRHERGWQVSWLPDRDNLTLNQAHDALLIAKLSHSQRVPALARRDWLTIRRLALGIGVNPRTAVKHIRDFEAREREQGIPTAVEQIPHLAVHLPARPEPQNRVIQVDAPTPPTVRTPDRAPGQWLMSGEFLDMGVWR